jgi:hypothetical protein
MQHRFHRSGGHQKSNQSGEACRAVILPRQADADAHGEQQTEIVKDRIAGGSHRGPID